MTPVAAKTVAPVTAVPSRSWTVAEIDALFALADNALASASWERKRFCRAITDGAYTLT